MQKGDFIMVLNAALQEFEHMDDENLYDVVSAYYKELLEDVGYDVLKLMDECNESQFYFILADLYCGIAGDIYEFVLMDYMRALAVFLEDALNEVGAYGHAKRLVRYAENVGVDLERLDEYVQGLHASVAKAEDIISDWVDLFGWLMMGQEFIYMNEIEPMKKILIQYIKNNLEDLVVL